MQAEQEWAFKGPFCDRDEALFPPCLGLLPILRV